MLLNIEHLYKYFNGEPILKDINLTVENNEIIGLIGSNGCGKSTLLNIITGNLDFDKTADGLGSVSISQSVRIGFLKQNSGLDSDSTIIEEMKNAFAKELEILDRMKYLEKHMSELSGKELESATEEYAEKSAFFESREGYNINVKIDKILNGMGFENTPKDRIISTLSGGEKTRLALAKLLLEEPDLLILDEPTNHLDFQTLMWLEDYLKTYKGSIIIVSHDRYFLNRICTRICEISRGKLTSFRGDYSAYLVQKKMNDEREMKEYLSQQKEIGKLEDYIAKNKVRASTAKMAKSRQHMLDKIEVIEKPQVYEKPPKIELKYTIEPTKEIVQVIDCPLVVGSGEKKKTLIENLNLNVRRSEHLGIIGANGIGKSSILKLIQGFIPHEKGKIIWGGNVKISYFDQEHATLNSANTVIEEIMEKCPSLSELEARKALASVLITGEDVFKPISVISGGERAKLCFAIMAQNKGNTLIMDEPTNHLDLSAKEVLEEALAQFEGTIILVSHDRYLLNKVATRIVEIKEDEVRSFKGGFDDYLKQINAEKQQEQADKEQAKKQAAAEEFEKKKKNQYRTKEMRAEAAKRRNRVRELEQLIEDAEKKIFNLEQEIADPEVASRYDIMSEKCQELEQTKTNLDEMMDEWAVLSDSLQ